MWPRDRDRAALGLRYRARAASQLFVLLTFEAAPVEDDPDLNRLTPREREILRQIPRGYSYKQVASRLTISTKTVETHVSSVLRKLQLSNRYELARWASDRVIVSCGRSDAEPARWARTRSTVI